MLAETGPTFVVQTRQASGAPTLPNPPVNKAVATQMRKTSVAVCVAPTRLVIDRKLRSLADGQSLSLPDGERTSAYQSHRRSTTVAIAMTNETKSPE